MSGERLARAALALDAIYCMAMGLLLVVFRARLGGLLGVPAALAAGVGVVAAGWSAVMLGQTVRMDWRTGIKQTVATNAVAATLLALAAAFHPARGARALLAFSAIDVATLAVAQVISLTRRGKHS